LSEEAKERLAEAVGRGDDLDALHALRWSLMWSAQAIGRLSREQSATAPVEAVFLLDDALRGTEIVSRAVPGLLAAADPGPDVGEYVQQREREIAEVRRRTAECRQQMDAAAKDENELRDRLAEHDALRARVAELRRLERLVEVLDEIEGQRRVVEERLLLLRERANGTEPTLERGSAELLRLTQDQLSRLAPSVSTALEEAARKQAELAAAQKSLAGAEADVAAASARLAEHEVRLAELGAHADANRRLMEAMASFEDATHADGRHLTALERARVLIDGIEKRLHEVDTALSRALEAGDRASGPGRAVVAWSGEDPAGRR
jgi:DNA repair exonuclease SbcCD ATPase subunit